MAVFWIGTAYLLGALQGWGFGQPWWHWFGDLAVVGLLLVLMVGLTLELLGKAESEEG